MSEDEKKTLNLIRDLAMSEIDEILRTLDKPDYIPDYIPPTFEEVIHGKAV